MRFDNTRLFLDKFSGKSIAPEEILQLMLTILKDVLWENNNRPVNKLPIKDKAVFVSSMIPLCNALNALYQDNAKKLAEVRRSDTVLDKVTELAEIEAELAAIDAEYHAADDQLNRLRAMNSELQDQRDALSQLKEDIRDQETLKRRLEAEIAGMRSELDRVSGEELESIKQVYQRLAQRLAAEKANREALEANVAALKRQLQEEAEARKAEEKDTETAYRLLDGIRAETAELRKQKEALDSQMAESEDKCMQLQAAILLCSSQIDENETRRQQLEAKCLQAKASIQQTAQAVKQLEEDCSTYTVCLQELESQHSTLASQLQQAKDAYEEKQNECDKAQKEKQAMKLFIEEAEQRLAELKNELLTLSLQKDTVQKQKDTYFDQVLCPVQAEYERLRSEEYALQEEKEELDNLSVTLSQSIQDLTAQCITLKNTMDILAAQEEVQLKNRDALQRQKDSLERRFAMVNEKCRELQNNIEKLETEYEGLDAKGTEERLLSKKGILETLIQDCIQLQHEITEYDAKITEKTKRDQALQADLALLVSKEQGIQSEIDRINQRLAPLGEDSFCDRVRKLEQRLELLKTIRSRMSSEFQKLGTHNYWAEDKKLDEGVANVEDELRILLESMSGYAAQWIQNYNDAEA